MIKSIGLGICCLTLALSSVTRASIIDIGGKIGDDKGIKCDDQGKGTDCHFEVCPGSQLGGLDLGDLKLVLDPCTIGKGGHGVCDLKWSFTTDHPLLNLLCDLKDHGTVPPICKVTVPCGDDHGCIPPCDPAAVPAPASAAFGGLGVVGIMVAAGLRSRKARLA